MRNFVQAIASLGKTTGTRMAYTLNGALNLTNSNNAGVPNSSKNFGGDKSWPAPQVEWPKLIGREWPPPAAFDSMPARAVTHDGVIELVNPLDPGYGIRVRRTISLDSRSPVMTIRTARMRFVRLFGENGRLVPRAGADLEDLHGPRGAGEGGHERDDVGLRDRLAVADR